MADNDYQYVKLPDGSYGKFAANATDEQIKAQIQKDFPNAFQSWDERHPYIATARDLGVGAIKGAGQTANNIGKLLIPDRAIRMAGGTPPTEQQQKSYFEPTNTAQSVGKTAEQTAEWLLPTGVEEKAASLVASHAPQIARIATPAAKIAASALESGVRNKLQGGDFSTGATVGAIGTAATPVLKKAANTIAEVAVSPGKRLLKSVPEGVNIGETIIDKSRGVRPKTITRQLDSAISDQSSKLDSVVAKADRGGPSVSLQPARQIAKDELATAVEKNSPGYIQDVKNVNDQLKYQYQPRQGGSNIATTPTTKNGAGFVPVQVSGTPTPVTLPDTVLPSRARAVKQGIDLEINNWNPESQNAIAPLQERVRGALNSEFHAAVPGAEPIDRELTSLIPARDAAWNTSYNPGVTRNIFTRIARPTGALVGAGLGAEEGYKKGGTSGAIAGGAMGLVLPELITSPTGQMIVARTLASPASVRVGKAIALPQTHDSDATDEETPQQ